MTPEVITQIFLSAALFIGVWSIIGNRVFKAFFSLLEEREARTTGDKQWAEQKREESRTILQQIDASLRETRLYSIGLRDEQVNKAKTEATNILGQATQKAQSALESARTQLKQQRSEIQRELEQEAEKLSNLVIERVLVTKGAPVIH